MGYQQSRKWADQYDSACNQAAGKLLYENGLIPIEFQFPSINEDRRSGIDMWMKIDPIKLAYRVRAANAEDYFYHGFTIRTSGSVSELDKVLTGNYADYLLYALAHEDIPGEIQAAFLIDCKSLGAQLNKDQSLLSKGKRGPGFVEIPYRDLLPTPVVVGYESIREPELYRKAVNDE